MALDNERAVIGHNNPPDPIDEALAPFGDAISEAENWLDGEPVQTEEQMHAVDSILGSIKSALKNVNDAEAAVTKPLHAAWKEEKERWKPTIQDLTRMKTGLVKLVAEFKAELARKQREEERQARAAAEEARIEAARAAREADEGNIEQVREAAELQHQAELAHAEMAAVSKAKVKGMRKVVKYQITEPRKLINWIATNDKPAMMEFMEGWARRNHRNMRHADGLDVWEEKEAF